MNVIVTDYGEFAAPQSMMALYQSAKIAKTTGQPDRRTRAGRAFAAVFRAFSDEKRDEYLNG